MTLSRRNLLELLAKLEDPVSSASIGKATPEATIVVQAESDHQHYGKGALISQFNARVREVGPAQFILEERTGEEVV